MTSFAHQAAQIDHGGAGEIPRGPAAGLQGADHGREDAHRAVEPHLPAGLAQRPLRAAQEAAGPAAEERARGRSRVPRHEGAGGHRRAGAAHAAPVPRTTASSAPRSSSWSSSRAPCSGTRRCRSSTTPSAPRSTTSRTGRSPRCIGGPGQGRPRRLRPGRQLLRPPARPLDQAVPRVGDRAPRGHGDADRLAGAERAARRRPRHASCTATTASTT